MVIDMTKFHLKKGSYLNQIQIHNIIYLLIVIKLNAFLQSLAFNFQVNRACKKSQNYL